MKVEFYKHSLGELEKQALGEVLDGVFLTTGPRTKLFEDRFAAYLGVRHGVGLSNCTAALFLTLKAWGVGKNDRVIVPAMTFVASSNIVLHAGAEVVFCDVEPKTGLIDLNQVEEILRRDSKVRAIIPVHLYGQMVDMKELRRLADASGVRILEDSAHCVEGLRDGVRPGQLSDAAAFSFYATKSLTSGEGGAAVTNDEALAEWLRIIRLHGMSKSATARYQHYEHWDMAEPGYKENMFELQAALLLPQLAKLERLWEKREAIAQRYEAAFAAAGIEFPQTLPSVKNARHLYTIWTPDGRRDDILAFLQRQGIGVAVNYRAVHLREYYQRALGFREGDFPTAEAIGRRTISLPLYPRLETEEIDYVIDKVIEAHRVAR